MPIGINGQGRIFTPNLSRLYLAVSISSRVSARAHLSIGAVSALSNHSFEEVVPNPHHEESLSRLEAIDYLFTPRTPRHAD